MGCIWAGGDYNLLTNILRGEFGLRGIIVTDYSNANDYIVCARPSTTLLMRLLSASRGAIE